MQPAPLRASHVVPRLLDLDVPPYNDNIDLDMNQDDLLDWDQLSNGYLNPHDAVSHQSPAAGGGEGGEEVEVEVEVEGEVEVSFEHLLRPVPTISTATLESTNSITQSVESFDNAPSFTQNPETHHNTTLGPSVVAPLIPSPSAAMASAIQPALVHHDASAAPIPTDWDSALLKANGHVAISTADLWDASHVLATAAQDNDLDSFDAFNDNSHYMDVHDSNTFNFEDKDLFSDMLPDGESSIWPPLTLQTSASPSQPTTNSAVGDMSYAPIPTHLPDFEWPIQQQGESELLERGVSFPTASMTMDSLQHRQITSVLEWTGLNGAFLPAAAHSDGSSFTLSATLRDSSSNTLSRSPSTLPKTHRPSVDALSVNEDRQPPLIIIPYDPIEEAKYVPSQKRHALEAEQDSKRTLFVDDKGIVQGTIAVFGNKFKKRATFSVQQKKETAIARKEGVCDRCRKSKRKCDLFLKEGLYEGCTTCQSGSYKGVLRMPCFQSTLQETIFFRFGPSIYSPCYTSRQQVYHLQDCSLPQMQEVRTLKLTQNADAELTVYVAQFLPQEGDRTARTWIWGNKKFALDMPHYCLTNMETTKLNIIRYIYEARNSYLQVLGTADELTWGTLQVAVKYAKTRLVCIRPVSHYASLTTLLGSLVDMALNLWATSRAIERYWEICGEDTLGISPVTDPHSPFFGFVPVTPIMDTQLDQIVIQEVLNPLRMKLVERLEETMKVKNPTQWFEMYLTIFVLLSHFEMAAKHSNRFAKSNGRPTRFSNMKEVEGWFHSSKILLAHFHYMCNGSAPLRLSWTSRKSSKIAKLDADQVRFMERTQTVIADKEADMRRLRTHHSYETPLYWCHQLFFDDWDSASPHIHDEE